MKKFVELLLFEHILNFMHQMPRELINIVIILGTNCRLLIRYTYLVSLALTLQLNCSLNMIFGQQQNAKCFNSEQNRLLDDFCKDILSHFQVFQYLKSPKGYIITDFSLSASEL